MEGEIDITFGELDPDRISAIRDVVVNLDASVSPRLNDDDPVAEESSAALRGIVTVVRSVLSRSEVWRSFAARSQELTS